MMKTIPHTPKDFNWTQWKKKDMQSLAEMLVGLVSDMKNEINQINGGERTFANTVLPYEEVMREIGVFQCKLHLLASVSLSKEVRQASQSTLEWMHGKLVDLLYDAELYCAFKEYAEYGARKEKLAPDATRLVRHLVRDYKRMGLDLPPGQRSAVKKNEKLVTKLSLQFSKNLNEYHDEIRVTRRELDGLPESYINRLKRDSKGKFIVTLKYPDLLPFLRHAASEKRRKELTYKYLRYGGAANVVLLHKILMLREATAKLLGYATHPHFVLEVKMAKTPERVMKFISDLVSHTKSSTEKETAELVKCKRKYTNNARAKLEYHDIAFYGELVRREKFKLDSEKVREYFPLEFVRGQMFEIYSQLLSVRFRKLSGFELWSPDVELYEVTNTDKSLIGYFGLDMYPREGKYGHMAAFNVMSGYAMDISGHENLVMATPDPLRSGTKSDKIYSAPICFLVGNFPRPGAKSPSLLSHGEVDTLFHEFGHIMHFTLGHSRFASQNSFAVAGDFVEMPSQMLENWTWDRGILKKLSRHYKTGKPMPDDMINNILAGRNFLEAYGMTRQMVLASYDMLLHLHPPKTASRINDLMATLNKKFTGIAMPKGSMFGAGFGHLTGGYDAGYYGYAWSKVYAADLFTRFEKEGILSARAGKDYRKLLAKAATEDEMKIITEFLGRKPNNKAFLRQLKKK